MPATMTPDAAQAHAQALVPALREAIREAAGLALPFYRAGEQTGARIWSKAGGSPVTEADQRAEAVILAHLAQSGIPVLIVPQK